MEKEYSDLEIAEHYAQQAAKCFAHALTLDKSCPEGAAQTLDYGQHCAVMSEIYRLKHSDELTENSNLDESFLTPCWR